jgi:hypothetical protein
VRSQLGNDREAELRKVKVKRLRSAYVLWLERILPTVPKGKRPISFRMWRRRVERAAHAV